MDAQIFLEFIENHQTVINAGEYRFTVTQELSGKGIGTNDKFAEPPAQYYFKVAGERFVINPSEVTTVFPPNNSLGKYSHVLPHIALRRETLPWERLVANDVSMEKAPWMALLVLNPEEMRTDQGATPGSVKDHMDAENGYVKKLAALTADGSNWPPKAEPGDSADESIRVIYVDKGTLENILPKYEQELSYLAHARQSRIGLDGLSGTVNIEIKDSKDNLVHREMNREAKEGQTLSLQCGELKPDEYTILVDTGQSIKLIIKASDSIGDEVGIVVANRLPQPGKKTIVHLVSLEGRFKVNPGEKSASFNFDGYKDAVPLVSLYSWSFTALTEKETFRQILLNLNQKFLFGVNFTEVVAKNFSLESIKPAFHENGIALSNKAVISDTSSEHILGDSDHIFYIGKDLAVYDAAGRRIIRYDQKFADIEDVKMDSFSFKLKHNPGFQAWIKDGSASYFLVADKDSQRLLVYRLFDDNTPTLRLPELEGDASIETPNRYLRQGYAPLRHFFRNGGKSVSWYRGALLPGRPSKLIDMEQFPVDSADELLQYHKSTGMFDTSYAAAWQLGRLLCLANKRTALDLYHWKRSHIRLLKAMEQQYARPHLPFRANAPDKIVLPKTVETWLSDLSLLKGIPFQYLVPDEKMLPEESIRFFCLDPVWIASLVDGALSIGRTNRGHDKILFDKNLKDTTASAEPVCGVLLRTRAVKDWPNLLVHAYTGKNKAVPCLRKERLTDEIMICLFEHEFDMLEVSEKPETVHFGFNQGDSIEVPYFKKPVGSNGKEIATPINLDGNCFVPQTRKFKVAEYVAKLKQESASLGFQADHFSSAQFALSMIEGVSRVQFRK